MIKYKDYEISYNPKVIPDRRWDYDFQHNDYDGACDSGDHRWGEADSIASCKAQIDALDVSELRAERGIDEFDEMFPGTMEALNNLTKKQGE